MSLTGVLPHLIIGLLLFGMAVAIARLILARAKVVDLPNNRSSHANPTPTTGGLAIVATFFTGMGMLYLIDPPQIIKTRLFLGLGLASLMISAMSFFDDLSHKPFLLRLGIQALGALLAMFSGITLTNALPDVHGPLLIFSGYLVTLVWLLGLTNAFNFMDGLNGMAGVNALVAALSLGAVSLRCGHIEALVVCSPLIAGTLGFLVFNFPKGRLFMGDVGSTFLGFFFAAFAVSVSVFINDPAPMLLMPLILFQFIFDTFFTFVRRAMNRENVFQAHRSHLYQLLNRMGASHVTVTLIYAGLGILQSFAALLASTLSLPHLLLTYLPFALAYLMSGFGIVKQAKRKGII